MKFFNSQFKKYNCSSTHSYNRKIWVDIPFYIIFLCYYVLETNEIMQNNVLNYSIHQHAYFQNDWFNQLVKYNIPRCFPILRTFGKYSCMYHSYKTLTTRSSNFIRSGISIYIYQIINSCNSLILLNMWNRA